MIDFLSDLRSLTDPRATIEMAGAVIVLLVVVALVARRRSKHPRVRGKPLLTSNEIEFFYRLQRALPSLHVFPQVSFAAFITDEGSLSREARWSVRATFDRKIADFVICERGTCKVLALVELDDRSHRVKADHQRDALTKAAGYRTQRFESKNKPTEAEIAELFRGVTGVPTYNDST